MSEEKRYLDFQELFQTDSICLCRVFDRLLLRLENETGREGMSILATFAVWALPEPTEFLTFDGLNKMFANNLCDEE